jgi:hypothetical protein
MSTRRPPPLHRQFFVELKLTYNKQSSSMTMTAVCSSALTLSLSLPPSLSAALDTDMLDLAIRASRHDLAYWAEEDIESCLRLSMDMTAAEEKSKTSPPPPPPSYPPPPPSVCVCVLCVCLLSVSCSVLCISVHLCA